MNYQHIIWDFDGTLFDTYPAMNRAVRLAAADLGAVVALDRIARLMNQTMALCVETISMDYGLDREQFEARIAHYHARATPDEQPPLPGALEICQRVIDAGGYNHIFTHRNHESMGELLDWYSARPLFTDIVSVHDGYARKPNPAGFLAIMAKHRADPASVLAVGDRLLDVLAASNAGIDACLLSNDPGMLGKPRYVIGHLDEMVRVLGLE